MCFALAFTLASIHTYKWFRGSIVRSEIHLAFGGSRAYCFVIVVVECAHTTEKITSFAAASGFWAHVLFRWYIYLVFVRLVPDQWGLPFTNEIQLTFSKQMKTKINRKIKHKNSFVRFKHVDDDDVVVAEE